ncbi:alpha-amylase [Geobacter hydrogenophilus]|uniref:Alpha-amylase n=1 Tax=Geobacter hydrogenophilus TaxID=40983 RepID=A0A9W6FZ22_9BACT|nr:alpha-amylase family glycosyl hydrolase [Geobacter hydrogenophilus]MBT0894749.1 alpha-amylase [Geobacter hydrogenophilus]GLI37413.1 alpha-amylase [Geobacter hydrogenophilus]
MTITSNSTYFPFNLQVAERFWRTLDLAPSARELERLGRPAILFCRELAARLNRLPERAGRPVQGGVLNLYSLQGAIFRHLITRYAQGQAPGVLEKSLADAGFPLDSPQLAALLERFAVLFPPAALLYGDAESPAAWLAAGGTSRRLQAVEELLLLSLSAENSALDSFRELVDDTELAATTPYRAAVTGLERSLADALPVAGFGVSLTELLRAPLRAAPESLAGQLAYMRDAWSPLLPEELLAQLEVAFGIVEEETRPFWSGGGGAPAPVLEFGPGTGFPAPDDHYPEPEQFSADVDWMPNVVLMAKMVYVWLGQLSGWYGKDIQRLDQIPDEELDKLARWGVTGLWLIGIWERSPASQTIKRMCGNPEAIASAYSLFDYTIAHDLGGWEALADLRERALKRGIRLASDMVPNHTGIYSKWIVEHPDWFVQLDYPPYPTYRFTGADLSSSPEVSVHIEDGYWNKSDAAVVFKHYDHRNGRTRYIYHGNDGTSTPWNDTAQLDYLNPEVREAVTRTILHVAHNFPIIRFDAAMTLAKKHYQRLWFPQPGMGSGVPSRAEHGLTRAAFDAAMPEEFWRQVVDRAAAETPDTLLLAEAFWLMEGYFVRTLGMHRVYNSAFMNMLKMEENAKYRQTIKNVLEFNHEILKRFVNFMNNPDEKTAVEQFGKENKYFGAAVLLVTMPGLPMLGHGQVEGFHEKYGMEYKRAYWDEPVDEHLVAEHERRIFPLMRRRRLFSGSENFVLYDFFVDGVVNENVFAYSNRRGNDRGLVLYHNRYASTAGWIRSSTSRLVRIDSGETVLRQTDLGEALGVNADGRHYYVFRDYATGLEFIRHGREIAEKGLFVELEAYEYHAFLDFREIRDDDYGTWGKLCFGLEGRGVPSIDEEVQLIRYASLVERFRELFPFVGGKAAPKTSLERSKAFQAALAAFLEELASVAGVDGDGAATADAVTERLDRLPGLWKSLEKEEPGAKEPLFPADSPDRWLCAMLLVLHETGRLGGDDAEYPARSVQWFGTFGLRRALVDIIRETVEEGDDPSHGDPDRLALLADIVLSYSGFGCLPGSSEGAEAIQRLMDDRRVRRFIGVNRSGVVEWFVKEPFEELLSWLVLFAAVTQPPVGRALSGFGTELAKLMRVRASLMALAEEAGYRVKAFLALVTPSSGRPEEESRQG